ncbi:MAG TPA: DUF378 domain-containing protein [Ignavibacteriaceae bacterium]|nr:DUF378 domain-containing protein [Ignavibacteriaceae bacterium]
MKNLNLISQILIIVGGLNWGLVGAFGFDLVAAIFGEMTAISRIVYILVGISAVYQVARLGLYLNSAEPNLKPVSGR